MEAREKALRNALAEETGRQMLLQGFDHPLFEIGTAEVGSGRADDPQSFRKQSIGVERVEGREKHPPGEIARRAEQQ